MFSCTSFWTGYDLGKLNCTALFTQSFQKQACLALRNLVARNPEHCEIILEAGAESLIRKAHGKMDDCEDLAKAALRDLGCDVELKELWTGTGQGRVQR